MSVFRSALNGAAWFAAGSWVQLVFSLASFIVVVRHVEPGLVGAFNAGAAITALIDMVVGPSLSLSLSQRATIDRRHIDATFWIGLAVGLILVLAIMLSGRWIFAAINAPQGWPLLMTVALAWPMTIVTSVFSSLLSRDLRFAVQGRIAMLAGLFASSVSIATVLAGGGVWALVLGDMTFRITKFCGIARALRYRPGPPRDLGAIFDLLSFNMMTLLTLALAYADIAVPRLLTSFLLGPAALGYLSLALRSLDLLSQLTLYPISQVMMVSVAKLARDLEAMRQLIRTIYRIAAGVAYPVFLGAVMLAPHLVWLIGPRWAPAILPMQIMLLVGLRNATGVLNTGIFQGTGKLVGSAIMLASGLGLQLVLVPLGSRLGLTGVATAILLRTLITWPLACVLIRNASGLSIADQARTGRSPLIAGLAMCAIIAAARLVLDTQSVSLDLITSIGLGGLTYAAVFVGLEPDVRRVTLATIGDLARRDFASVRQRLLGAFSI